MQQFEPGAFRSSKGFILKHRIELQIDRIISEIIHYSPKAQNKVQYME